MKQLLPISILFFVNFNSLSRDQLVLNNKVEEGKRNQHQIPNFNKS